MKKREFSSFYVINAFGMVCALYIGMKTNRYLVSWVNYDGAILGRREIRAQSDDSAIKRGQRIVRQEKAFGFWCWSLSDGFRVVHDGDLRVGG